jgi:hypothetical protein|tara:strand:+ start:37 stop:342 length:306 start_codon:yes stop_codon:yes gene_type:complete
MIIIMLMTNQTQQFKKLVSNAKPESQIPKVESMCTVSSLMTTADQVQFKKGLSSIFVDVPHHSSGESQIFSVRPQQLVPRSAVIQRDETSQLVGISAVSGG